MRLLPVIEEDYEQYEEETLCVVGDLPRFEDDELYFPSDREEIIYDFPMVKKYLARMIEVCENMPRCYKDYLTLGKNIGGVMTFKEYVYLKYGFWP